MEHLKINLLIVDDGVQFLHLIRCSIEMPDFNVLTATRGDETLEISQNPSPREILARLRQIERQTPPA